MTRESEINAGPQGNFELIERLRRERDEARAEVERLEGALAAMHNRALEILNNSIPLKVKANQRGDRQNTAYEQGRIEIAVHFSDLTRAAAVPESQSPRLRAVAGDDEDRR